MESVQNIKQRFEIIGNDPKLNRAIEKAIQVAPTDISVLVVGESGVGADGGSGVLRPSSSGGGCASLGWAGWEYGICFVAEGGEVVGEMGLACADPSR